MAVHQHDDSLPRIVVRLRQWSSDRDTTLRPGSPIRAYAVEAEFTRLRMAAGRKVRGLKVGYANKAMW
jgi:hypothetical protein